jgi:hypothetical protein
MMIAMAKYTKDQFYQAYKKGRKNFPISLSCCRRRASISVEEGIPELWAFQSYRLEYRIT